MKKRTQRDYTFSFKLSVVSQVEQGELTYTQAQNTYGIQGKSTVLSWLRKHGSRDWSTRTLSMKSKSKETPAQKIKRLEKELSHEKIKTKILNKMIDISDQQYGTSIRKKFLPKQSSPINNKKD
jgi:transposase-like protein